MTIVDAANFRKSVYDLIENEDSIVEREDITTLQGLAEAFLAGKVAIYYDPNSRCLCWATTDIFKDR